MELSENKQLIVERHNKAVYVDGDRIVKVFKLKSLLLMSSMRH